MRWKIYYNDGVYMITRVLNGDLLEFLSTIDLECLMEVKRLYVNEE